MGEVQSFSPSIINVSLTIQGYILGYNLADVEIVVDPGILVPRKYLSWQKIFGKVTM